MDETGEGCAIRYDGNPLAARPDENLIDLLVRHGRYLPHICYHPSLGPVQTCDSCWIVVDGAVTRGCTVRVRDGMTIESRHRGAEAARTEGLNRLFRKHELYCSLCDNNNGNCEIHEAVHKLGVAHQAYPFRSKPYDKDESNPFYRYDPDQCILCGRCVEACQTVQVTETLSIDWEAENPRVLWDGGQPINESSCVSCGHCVTVCPCNALMEKSMIGHAGPFTGWPAALKRDAIDVVKAVEPAVGFRPLTALSKVDQAIRAERTRKTKTVCTYCGVGCSFEIWTRDRHILKVQPVPEAPANGISTCVKGKFGWDFVNSPDRLTTPLIREGDTFRPAGWDEALSLIARRLGEIKAAHGPDALAVVGSSKCSNEEAYLTQKLARAVIGTNNVDNCSRYCQTPATTGLTRTVGYGGDSGTFADIQQAELVLIIGSNTADSHPVLATKLRRRKKLHGMKFIVADLRRHEMARRADLFLKPEPGTDLIWLSALSRYILDQGLEDKNFLAERVNNLDAYRDSLAPYTLDYAEEVAGIPRAQLIQAAEMIVAAKGVCALWAMGVTQNNAGSDTSTAISNLLLVTGNYGKPGSGGYPLRGHNNVQGASDFGVLSDYLPGYRHVLDPGHRAAVGAIWGVEIPDRKGLNNHTMIGAVHDGALKAMYIVGEDMAIVDANTTYTQAAFEKLDFMVVQDIFMTATARFADVVLPGAPSLEKEGTFVNTERRIQHFDPALPPLGDSRPDWRILVDLARAMGADWDYEGPSDVMDEAVRCAPLLAGVRYDRLRGFDSLCWPVDADGHYPTLLYKDRFHFPDGKARLYPLAYIPPAETRDNEYDVHLNNGRVLEHFHEANLTGRVAGLVAKVPELYVEVSEEMAAARGYKEGTVVRITSRRGAVKAKVHVTPNVGPHDMFLPEFSVDEPVNALSGNHADAVTSTPAYKQIAVKVEVLERDAAPALPRSNPRFGRPTPRRGVEVERKWARPDYAPPPAPDEREGGLI